MTNKTLIIGLCLVSLICGCKRKRKLETWEKREQRYEDKTPEEWVKLIQNPRQVVRREAARRLIYGGEEVVPMLIEAFEKNKRGGVRLSIARVFGDMGPTAAPAVPALCQALKDKNWAERDVAAETLGKVRSNPEETLPALTDALKDTESRVRIKAAEAIARLRPNAPDIIAALIENLEDEDENVRANTCDALGAIGPPANSAVPALQKLTKQESVIVQMAADEALRKINR